MSKSPEQIKLDTCGCCEGVPESPGHVNRPGLSTIEYRIGVHSEFFERMLNRIYAYEITSGENEGRRPLATLTTRANEDPAIALMDAWSSVSDVLTFYQERIANEGFLRTATERRSILELARSIGYELSPGVSAESYVAFTVDNAEGAPTSADVPKGTQIQSMPKAQGELPQTFETSETIEAKVKRNALLPRLNHPQTLFYSSSHIYLKGLGLDLKAGDLVLLNIMGSKYVKKIHNIVEDTIQLTTRVDFEANLSTISKVFYLYDEGQLNPDSSKLELTLDNVDDYVRQAVWLEEDLQAFIQFHEWDEEVLLAFMDELRQQSFSDPYRQLYVFRDNVSFFGHNAPLYKSLPKEVRSTNGTDDSDKAYPHDWDTSGMQIWNDSLTNQYYNNPADENDHVFLERVVDDLVDKTWMLIKKPGTSASVFKIESVSEQSRTGFGMSSKVTGLQLKNATGSGLTRSASYKVRNTVAFVNSENIELAPLPITDNLYQDINSITLNSMVLGLKEGQAISISGEDEDTENCIRNEIGFLKEVTHREAYTTITLEDGLSFNYKRNTVTINANVVLCSHGETVNAEVLGSGNGAMTHQQFKIKKPPLSYTSSSNVTGIESSLSVRVSDVEWQQLESLYGKESNAEVYTVRIDNEANANIIFGDGKSGARLPTGQENVVATYRSGIGLDGEVAENSLTLLKTRPYGIRSVTNPLAASGGDDPEKLENARTNAPLTVVTLDRIVSLQDYEDFAAGFPGIGKAQAVEVWNGESLKVHITVATASGKIVTSPLYDNLLTAIEGARDPLREAVLDSYQPYMFFICAKVKIHENYLWDKVKPLIETKLLEQFSFSQRTFGQPVTAAEVMEVIHSVTGVIAVDIDELYKTSSEESISITNKFNTVLDASIARYDKFTKSILPADLLLIHEFGIDLSEMSL